jgi:tRNA threonylcarbamoyladenosine biosynthesis protein TsaE
MPQPDWLHAVRDEAAVATLAAMFSRRLQPPLTVYLRGDLGAGKTTFARALIQALGYSGRVKSPTYGLLESYEIDALHVLHLDLYRIEDPEELDYLAIRDLFDAHSLLLVEWPEKGQGNLPPADLELFFGESASSREISCFAKSITGKTLSDRVLEQF